MTAPPQVEWGIYPWLDEQHGDARIHPRDAAAFRKLAPFGKVFRSTGVMRGAFLVLEYGTLQFRVAPDLFQPLAIDPFPIGTRVMIAHTQVETVVRDIVWLPKEQKVTYFVTVEGQREMEQYERTDLAPL